MNTSETFGGLAGRCVNRPSCDSQHVNVPYLTYAITSEPNRPMNFTNEQALALPEAKYPLRQCNVVDLHEVHTKVGYTPISVQNFEPIVRLAVQAVLLELRLTGQYVAAEVLARRFFEVPEAAKPMLDSATSFVRL